MINRKWCYDEGGQHFQFVSVEDVEKLEAENADLLAACKAVLKHLGPDVGDDCPFRLVADAIARAEPE
jgi:hypothetical protein